MMYIRLYLRINFTVTLTNFSEKNDVVVVPGEAEKKTSRSCTVSPRGGEQFGLKLLGSRTISVHPSPTPQQEAKGIANPKLVKAKQARREEAERKAAQAEAAGGGGGLKVSSMECYNQEQPLICLFPILLHSGLFREAQAQPDYLLVWKLFSLPPPQQCLIVHPHTMP